MPPPRRPPTGAVWRAVVAVLPSLLVATAGAATDAPGLPGGSRPPLAALAGWLPLTAAQQQALRQQRAAFDEGLRRLAAEQATDAGAPRPELCLRSLALVAQHRAQALAGLSAEQRSRLAQLEQALALLPVLEAAQAAGLVADRLPLPPGALPTGSAVLEQAWLRQPAVPWPGCPGTRVLPELAPPDPAPQQRPPG